MVDDTELVGFTNYPMPCHRTFDYLEYGDDVEMLYSHDANSGSNGTAAQVSPISQIASNVIKHCSNR
jgi:hypothetical protein